MKKSILFIMMMGIVTTLFSQEKMNKLSVDPLQLFYFGINNFEYERGFNEGKLGVSFFYGTSGRNGSIIGDYKFYVSEQNVTVKTYLNTLGSSSFWYGGQLSLASGDIFYYYDSNQDYNEVEYEKYKNNRATNIATLGVLGKLGYQFVIKSFYFDIFGGVGYAITNNLYGKANYKGDVKEKKLLFTYGIKTGIIF